MKRSLRYLLLIAAAFVAGNTYAQIHPLAFGTTNWYADYNGTRFQVVAPGSIAGNKVYTTSNDGLGGTTPWGGFVTTPLVNIPVIMPPGTDSTVTTTTLVAGSMAGKIALVYRGGSEFGHKAHQAELAGAIACVIVNNVPGNPVGMGPGLEGGSVTIPVFMVSQADGNAMDAQYRAGTLVNLTITPWGEGLNNDLGFVNQGAAGWHNYATPYNQMVYGPSPTAFNGMDGAYVANYGLKKATNVSVTDTLSYTPKGFATTRVHTGATGTLSLFNPIDSIYAMLPAAEYTFAPTTGPGRFDLKYTIKSDSIDANPGDNSTTLSFYASDSVYSKANYDFVNNRPAPGIFEGLQSGGDFLLGPTYYVRHGGTAISSVQFSLANNTPGPIGLSSINVYAMKWTDGYSGFPVDGIVQNAELQLVSLGIYNFAPGDTSGGVFKVSMGDPATGIVGSDIFLDSNSWYYIAVEVPGGYFLGCDGHASANPRIYGRYHVGSYIEYSNIFYSGLYSSGLNPLTGDPFSSEYPSAFAGPLYVNSVDSFNYSQQRGVVPSVAMIVNNTPSTIAGSSTVCVGSSVVFTDISTGGLWSSSNTAIATVGAGTGLVTGVATGTVTISYSSTPVATKTITISTAPVVPSITGTTSICTIGGVGALSDAMTGGTWTSSLPVVASIDMITGALTGRSTGTSVITYTITNSCGISTATTIVSVNPSYSAGTILGASSICVGGAITVSETVSGGSWSTDFPGIASISSIGVLNGIAAGMVEIIYSLPTPCGTATTGIVIDVDALPNAGIINGPDHVCVNGNIRLTDDGDRGTWTSSNANASISSIGNVLGVTTGADVITYTVTNACGTSNTQFLITVEDCVNKVNSVSGVVDEISIYPNPGYNIVTLKSGQTIHKVEVYDAPGKLVIKMAYNATHAVVDMSDLIPGVYIFKVNDTKIIKVIKQ